MEPKRFSISKLELARINPKDFGTHLKEDSPEPFTNSPKSVRWLNAVGVYHKEGNLSDAINNLENSFSNRKKNKKNIAEVETLINALISYVNDHSFLEYNFFSHRHKMEINLSDKLKTTGWIWIINKTYNGFSGYVIVNDNDSHNWQNQLRFPIIQNYIATKIFKCPIENVEVGIINYYEGKHHKTTFSQEDITYSLNELKLIGNEISSLF